MSNTNSVKDLKVLERFQTPNKDRILFPIRPYHQRMQEYIAKRNLIFSNSSLFFCPKKRPKRSTVRLRTYFKKRRITSKFIVSTVLKNTVDRRFYANVRFLNFSPLGLLDTGANISCIGGKLAQENFSGSEPFHKMNANVKTADGKLQKVLGYLDVYVSFRNQSHRMKLWLVPSLSQDLILGLDF